MIMKGSRSATTGLIRDVRDFVLKSNIFNLAVAIAIGVAFGKIITSFVETILMPILSLLIPGGSWREARIVLGVIPDPQRTGAQIENAILIGQFLAETVDFLLISAVIFLLLKTVASRKRHEERLDIADTKECIYCLSIVPFAASKCGHCTTDLPPMI
jgi:large conductance mechanosensitive channel